MTVAIQLRDVAVRFDGTEVVSDVDLHVPAGERLALLGPSGSGKSTILRVIAGLVSPSRGQVRFDGVEVTEVPAEQRGVGFVFQHHALFPHLDVADNVAFGLRHGPGARPRRRHIDRRVTEVLELLSLGGLADRRVGSLSGGESQRVAIARALAPDPGALVLDEPFGALDQALRERLLDDLAEVFDAAGATVVVVTHDPTEAAALAPSMAVLVDGRIRQHGRSVDVLARPADTTVATLLGHRNLVAGSSVGLADDVVLVPPGAVVVDGGPVAGTVVATRVRGGLVTVVLEVAGDRLETAMPSEPLEVGAAVGLSIDLDAVVTFGEERPGS